MKKRLINAISLFAMLFTFGLGYASWEFTGSSNSENAVNIVIGNFTFNSTWTDSDKLTEEAYESATDFEYAINNPDTPEGQAWKDAWSSKNTLGNSYVGSMDQNAGDSLDIVFDYEGANYIIKRKSQNEYYLYVTYEALNRPTGTVQPVYKTKYIRDESGNLVPVQSWVGRCNRNIYSVYQLTTYSFDTESFVEI